MVYAASNRATKGNDDAPMNVLAVTVEMKPNDMACELGIPLSLRSVPLVVGLDWSNTRFKTLLSIAFAMAPRKNATMKGDRCHARTEKKVPETRTDVD